MSLCFPDFWDMLIAAASRRLHHNPITRSYCLGPKGRKNLFVSALSTCQEKLLVDEGNTITHRKVGKNDQEHLGQVYEVEISYDDNMIRTMVQESQG